MTTQQLTGFNTSYTGLLRSVRAVQKSNRDNTKQWIENVLDLEHTTRDGAPVMVEFKLSKAAMGAGMFDKLKTLQGKVVTFQVSSQQRVWDGRIYTTYYFSQTHLPETLKAVA